MTSAAAPERRTLEAGVEKLRPVLDRRGFAYAAGDQGTSSGGAFAVANFQRGILQIGLVVRRAVSLGCPNYSAGDGYAGHHDLVWALGAEGQQQLVEGEWPSWIARAGGDAFEALRDDLDRIILAALDASEEQFFASLGRAVKKARSRLGIGQVPLDE